jgi:hypothetical protein
MPSNVWDDKLIAASYLVSVIKKAVGRGNDKWEKE